MDSEETINLAVKYAKDAIKEDENKNYQKALDLYTQSLQYFHFFCKYEKNPQIKDSILKKMEIYMTRAENLKKIVSSGKELIETNNEKSSNSGDFKGNMENEIKNCMLSNKNKNIQWQDICGLETAKSILLEAIIFPLRFPKLFNSNRLPYKGILLYGPPGTGKTFLALACANECNMNFFNVSSSDLVSKYQGESEKYIKCLFKVANENSPAIIFIDEIDSLCSSRTEGEHESTRRIKTEFLINMSGLNTYENNIIILGATNTPWSLDYGFRRRFEKRILIPLPNTYARVRIFESHLKKTEHNITKEEIKEFASMTENYSGADIDLICRDALYMPIKKCLSSKFFKQVKKDDKIFYTPCSPGDSDPTKIEKNVMTIDENELLPPMLSSQDFKMAIQNVKPSISLDDLRKYDDWTRQYGINGA